MVFLAVSFLIRLVVFGGVLAFAARKIPGVKVEPPSALPVVALTFGLLNAVLYGLLVGIMNLASLWLLFFITPFVANAVLLWLTDRLLKPLKIDRLGALAATAGLLTVAHVVLRWVILRCLIA